MDYVRRRSEDNESCDNIRTTHRIGRNWRSRARCWLGRWLSMGIEMTIDI